MRQPDLSLHVLEGLPRIRPGDDLGALLIAGLRANDCVPQAGDVLAVAQKLVSKAEGRLVRLGDVKPSARAVEIAARADKDPRLVELVLRESNEVLRVVPGIIIVEQKLGIVLANAGIDRSNVGGDEEMVLLLPEDPDASAAALRERLRASFGVDVGVIVTDSLGRAWRMGTVGTCIGCAGVPSLVDLRGVPDLEGRALQVSEVAVADSLAAAAVLAMGEAAEGTPVVLIRGNLPTATAQSARDVLRPRAADLFR